MIILLFFAVMLFIASAASVYENDLMIRFYVTVRSRIATKLVLGRLPFLGGKNPPENRQRFTVIGIVLYSVSVLCMAFCIYTALTLEPVEGLEYGGGYSRSTMSIGDKYNSTEGLVRWISLCWMLFEIGIYMINSIGVNLGKPDITIHKVSIGILILVTIIFCMFMGWLCWQTAGHIWRDIPAARG